MNTSSSSGSRTLPSNTITNPKEDLKGITTQSGNAYKGPTIPNISSSPPKVVKHETEVTKATVPPTNNISTKDVQPLVVQIENQVLNSEHVVALVVKPVIAPLGDPDKFLIPCYFLRMDECLALADLDARINLRPLSVWNKLFLSELSPTCMTLELANRLISRPVRIAEDVFVKVGTFHFSADFVVIDFDADPRDPLILERSFLKTGRSLINIYEGELTLRFGKEAMTFKLDQTLRYSTNYDAMSVNRIDLIDVACGEYYQEVLGFFVSGNPTPSTETIPISPKINEAYYDSEGDILLHKEFLNGEPSSPPLPLQELKVVEPTNEKSSIDEPPMVELKDLTPHLEYAFLEGDDKLPIIIAKDLKDDEKTALIKVLKSHKQALTWQLFDIKGGFTVVENEENELIPTPLVTGWHEKSYFMVKEGIILGHKISKNGIEVDKAKITWEMNNLLEKDTPFFFSKECVEAFQTLKKKLTEAPILVAPDWDLPFELMCDASDFSIEKELLVVVYAFEKFQPYLVLSKSIVYTNHSALKYLFNKQDAKPRLLR
nr:reverse transcriptase domain-containing protein [Tanacetum cinerariifolium]